MSKIFISEYSFKLPYVKYLQDFLQITNNLPDAKKIKSTFNKQEFGDLIYPQIIETDEYYPQKADIKIMRTETVACVMAIQELVTNANLSEAELETIEFWVGSGTHSEGFLQDNSIFMKYLKKAYSESDLIKRNQKIYRTVPPLTGLNTLTNAAESYAAQYGGIKGSSTIFGTTSRSGFDALETASRRLKKNNFNKSIVGASNIADVSEFLSYYLNNHYNLKISVGAIFLLIENKKNEKSFASISNLKFDTKVPSINFENTIKLTNEFSSDLVIINSSGKNINFQNRVSMVIDIFDYFGYCGGMSLYIQIIWALAFLQSGKYKSIECIDIDLFGRMSSLTIKLEV